MAEYVKLTLEWMATYHLGQYIIKKMDSLLWSLEIPAKYSADEKSKNDSGSLPWPVFWIIFIELQIFRFVLSMAVARYNRKPIEPRDLVRIIQKWRRSLRCIRFRGLQTVRENHYRTGNSSQRNVATSPMRKPTKKRYHDDMLDYELLDELMNRTFSDTDNTDSTFMISKFGDISANSSEEYQSPSKYKDSTDASLQETLPVSASEAELRESNTSTKSNEATFVSTVDTEESALTEEEPGPSTSSQAMHGEKNDAPATDSTVQPNVNSNPGKESLNAPVDPVDALMFKFVQMEKEGKLNLKMPSTRRASKKKRIFSLGSDDNLDRLSTGQGSKSQEN